MTPPALSLRLLLCASLASGSACFPSQDMHRLGDRRWIEVSWSSHGTGLLESSDRLLEHHDGAFVLVADSISYLEYSDWPTGMCLLAQAGDYELMPEAPAGAVRAIRRISLSAVPARDFDTASIDLELTLVFCQARPGTPFELIEPAGLAAADRNGLVVYAARRWLDAHRELERQVALSGTAAQQETLRRIVLIAESAD